MCENRVYATTRSNILLNSVAKFLESKTFFQKGFGRRRQKKKSKEIYFERASFLKLGNSMKITVLCGGDSPERAVSLRSGMMVAHALKEIGHDVICVDILTGDFAPFKDNAPIQYSAPIHNSIISLVKECDKVFLALHGGIGENGQLQAFLDCLNVSYTGSSYVPSTICMDKSISRALLSLRGIPTPRGETVICGQKTSWSEFPCCVKPANAGSSLGISFPNNKNELDIALKNAFSLCRSVIIEEKLTGRELTVGILDGKALPIVEILPKTDFYNYESKYDPALVTEICPAYLTTEEEKAVKSTALAAKDALLVDSYCRVDIILSNGVPYCLEINTLPGMTNTSLLPLSAKAAGISFPELCQKIINEALK